MIDKNTPLISRPEFVRLAPVVEYHLAVTKQLNEQKQSAKLQTSKALQGSKQW